MKWFKRCFWLAAWSVWLWCGFGLYRELPKTYGAPVSRLQGAPIQVFGGQAAMAFVGQESKIVALGEKTRERLTWVRTFDALNGALLNEFEFPTAEHSLPFTPGLSSLRHSVAFFNGTPKPDGAGAAGFFLHDFRTGTWTRVAEYYASHFSVHEIEPWVLFEHPHQQEFGWTSRVVVFDLEKRKPIYVVERPQRREFIGGPFFIGRQPQIGIATAPLGARGRVTGEETLSIHDLTADKNPVRIFEDVKLDRGATTSDDGRIAYATGARGAQVEVLDMKSGQTIFSLEAQFDESGRPEWPEFPIISRDGGSIFVEKPRRLRRIASGEVIWSAKPHEQAEYGWFDDRFVVRESWGKAVEQWRQGVDVTNYAVRRLSDGGLIERLWRRPLSSKNVSADGRLVVDPTDGSVYHYPARPAWLWIFLAQTVLAQPLILLWALLSYRRRRAARRQPAEAPLSTVTS